MLPHLVRQFESVRIDDRRPGRRTWPIKAARLATIDLKFSGWKKLRFIRSLCSLKHYTAPKDYYAQFAF